MIFVCTLALIQKYKEGQNAFCWPPSIRTPVHSSTQRAVHEGRRTPGCRRGTQRVSATPGLPLPGQGRRLPPLGGNNAVPRSRMLDVRGARREGTLRYHSEV